MPLHRRLEDKIRALCEKLIASNQEGEFLTISAELQSALSEHVEELRTRLKTYPLNQDRRFTG